MFAILIHPDDPNLCLRLLADAESGCWCVQEHCLRYSFRLIETPPTADGELEARTLMAKEYLKWTQ